MQRPIFKSLGVSVEELDTPTLIVDLDVLERNINTMSLVFADTFVKLRPDVTVHRTPAIAHKQLAVAGSVGGICVTTVGQAEVFAQSGFTDILITNPVVSPIKIRRLCSLLRSATITVAVDSDSNISDLSKVARAEGVILNVIVKVNTGTDTFGVQPGQSVVTLASLCTDLDGLTFVGLIARTDSMPNSDGTNRESESLQNMHQILDTRKRLEQAGIEVVVVSIGGRTSYKDANFVDGVTEVRAGNYALMDVIHRAHCVEFASAAKVISSITSLPEEGVVIVDGGRKAVGYDMGKPMVDNLPGADLRGLSAEHGIIDLDSQRNRDLKLGNKIWLTPYDVGECFNLHDYVYGIRNGQLEAVWDVAARGHYR